MNEKHTPGPWKIITRTDDEGRVIIGEDGRPYSIRQATPGDAPWPVADCSTEADAKLIAAAPYLLAALSLSIEVFDLAYSRAENRTERDVIAARRDNALAAIKKATGGVK